MPEHGGDRSFYNGVTRREEAWLECSEESHEGQVYVEWHVWSIYSMGKRLHASYEDALADYDTRVKRLIEESDESDNNFTRNKYLAAEGEEAVGNDDAELIGELVSVAFGYQPGEDSSDDDGYDYLVIKCRRYQVPEYGHRHVSISLKEKK